MNTFIWGLILSRSMIQSIIFARKRSSFAAWYVLGPMNDCLVRSRCWCPVLPFEFEPVETDLHSGAPWNTSTCRRNLLVSKSMKSMWTVVFGVLRSLSIEKQLPPSARSSSAKRPKPQPRSMPTGLPSAVAASASRLACTTAIVCSSVMQRSLCVYAKGFGVNSSASVESTAGSCASSSSTRGSTAGAVGSSIVQAFVKNSASWTHLSSCIHVSASALAMSVTSSSSTCLSAKRVDLRGRGGLESRAERRGVAAGSISR